MKNDLKSSRNITIFSVAVFLAVFIVLLISVCYINFCISRQEAASSNKDIYKQLGLDLAEASDYLTNEVRLYAVTHDIVHLYNYWTEISETKTRDKVIDEFENSTSPEEEKIYLRQAKQYSDDLVNIETDSMHLVLISENKTAEDYSYDAKLQEYVQLVLDDPLPDEYTSLSMEDMSRKAVSILYDDVYESYKRSIMEPIADFQKLMNSRLESELANTKKGTSLSTGVLLFSAVFTLAAIGVLLFIFDRMYALPILKYTKSINNVYAQSVKVEPQGAIEMIKFGEAFNRLTDTVYEELNNRKNAEEKMRLAKKEAVAANKAKSIFLASMSHELRLPLNAVNGYSELLMETPLTEQQESYIRGLRSSSECLLGTINDILDYSKFESGNLSIERTVFKTESVLNEIRYVIANLAEQKGLAFELKIDENIPPLLVGDSLRLRQVLVNLANNAVKFTSEGFVTIEAKLRNITEDECDILFIVTDTGIGIDKESLDSIFKPFVQHDASTARNYGGTGLGLAICQQIVEGWNVGGEGISVKSTVGKGSEFCFKLRFGICDSIEDEEPESKPMYSGEKILIVDDSAVNIDVESEMLRSCGLSVLTSSCGVDAVELMKQSVDIAFVLMDIRMPGMNGFEASRRIRKISNHRSTPIIALTGDVLPETEINVKKSGMNGYLKKPFTKSRLYAVLKKHLPGYNEVSCTKQSYLEVASQYFSPEGLKRRIGDSGDAFEQIIRMFLDDYKNFPEILDAFKRQNDTCAAYELVHRLKGSSGSICCQRLFEQCGSFDKSLLSGSFKGIERLMSVFNETYFEVSEFYTTLMKDKSVIRIESSRTAVLEKLNEYCENRDFAAVNYFGENISMLRRNCKAENFVQIKKAVEQLDFKKVQSYLEKELNEYV